MPAKAVNMSEQDEFLKDLPLDGEEKTDAFGEPLVATPEKEEPEEKPRRDNRETRRLRESNQRLREEAIALGTRIEVLSETQKFRQDSGAEKPDETLARIYGTNTPEGAEATRLLQLALDAREQRAVDKALDSFRKEQASRDQEVSKELANLNAIEERIEDEFSVDLTSTEQARALSKAYFSYLERMSPKDEEGNVKDYADPFATFEEFQSKRSQSQQTNRSKDYASRGMVRSGASSETKLETSAQERYLKDLGII